MVSKVIVNQLWLAKITQTIPDNLALNTGTQFWSGVENWFWHPDQTLDLQLQAHVFFVFKSQPFSLAF